MAEILQRSVLMVTYYFPPHAVAASIRPAALAQILAQRDWNVHVVHAEGRPGDPRDDQWAEQLDQMGVKRHPVQPSRRIDRACSSPVGLLWRTLGRAMHTGPDLFDDWLPVLMPSVEQILRRCSINIVLGMAPPLSAASAAAEIARSAGLPLAVDIGEVVELIPRLGPFYSGRSFESTLEDLVRRALYLSVPTRREKESLLRRYDYLSHEEVGIVPQQASQDLAEQHPSTHSRVLAIADGMRRAIIRPLLQALRSSSTHQAVIAGVDEKALEPYLRQWQLEDRVHVQRAIAPGALDKWLQWADTAIVYATKCCTTPSSIVARMRSAGVPLIAIGDFADRLTAEYPRELVVHHASNSARRLRQLLESQLPEKMLPLASSDEVLEREFSRRLGIHMRL